MGLLFQPPAEVTRYADQLGAVVMEPAQRIDTHGIGGQQIGKVHPDVSPEGCARAPQFVYLRCHQAPCEQHRRAVRSLDDLDSTVHGEDRFKTDTTPEAWRAMPLCAATPRLVNGSTHDPWAN